MKKAVTYFLEEEKINKISQVAKKDKRSKSRQVEWMVDELFDADLNERLYFDSKRRNVIMEDINA